MVETDPKRGLQFIIEVELEQAEQRGDTENASMLGLVFDLFRDTTDQNLLFQRPLPEVLDSVRVAFASLPDEAKKMPEIHRELPSRTQRIIGKAETIQAKSQPTSSDGSSGDDLQEELSSTTVSSRRVRKPTSNMGQAAATNRPKSQRIHPGWGEKL